MKKVLLMLAIMFAILVPSWAGQSAAPAPKAQTEKSETSIKPSKLEKLEAKLQKKIAKKQKKWEKRKDGGDNLEFAKLAWQLTIFGLIGSLALGLLAAFIPFISILAGIASLAFSIGGIASIILWLVEKSSDNPNPEVMRYAKRGARVWIASVIVSLLLYIAAVAIFLVI